MKPEEIDNAIAALQAAKEGKKIEFRYRDRLMYQDDWLPNTAPNFRLDKFEYRPAPEPAMRTITAAELPPAGFAVRVTEDSNTYLVLKVTQTGFYYFDTTNVQPAIKFEEARKFGWEWFDAKAEAWRKFEVEE